MTLNSDQTKQLRNQKRKQFRHLKDSVPKFIIRICSECGLEKPCRFNSAFDIHGNPEYKTRCDDCHNKKGRTYSKENRKILTLQRKKAKNERKKKFVEYLGGKCYRCGYDRSTRALTFHHRDREYKEFSISQARDHSWEKLKKELDKCDLLCFNCHMEIEEELENKKE